MEVKFLAVTAVAHNSHLGWYSPFPVLGIFEKGDLMSIDMGKREQSPINLALVSFQYEKGC